jgi:hypothetical protein
VDIVAALNACPVARNCSRLAPLLSSLLPSCPCTFETIPHTTPLRCLPLPCSPALRYSPPTGLSGSRRPKSNGPWRPRWPTSQSPRTTARACSGSNGSTSKRCAATSSPSSDFVRSRRLQGYA